MTSEERAWLQSVHRQVMTIFGCCGAADMALDPNTKEARLVKRAALAALALATEISVRMREADMTADQSDGYDLAALASLPRDARELDDPE